MHSLPFLALIHSIDLIWGMRSAEWSSTYPNPNPPQSSAFRSAVATQKTQWSEKGDEAGTGIGNPDLATAFGFWMTMNMTYVQPLVRPFPLFIHFESCMAAA